MNIFKKCKTYLLWRGSNLGTLEPFCRAMMSQRKLCVYTPGRFVMLKVLYVCTLLAGMGANFIWFCTLVVRESENVTCFCTFIICMSAKVICFGTFGAGMGAKTICFSISLAGMSAKLRCFFVLLCMVAKITHFSIDCLHDGHSHMFLYNFVCTNAKGICFCTTLACTIAKVICVNIIVALRMDYVICQQNNYL